jgi:nickel-dependent lactate racemase
MSSISLKYGTTSIPFEFDAKRFEILSGREAGSPLSDAELGERLDSPIGSPPLEEIVSPGESVLVVVPDATRQTACGQVVNLLVRRLIAAGTPASDITIIFATGIHRSVTTAERQAILTPFIAQRIKTLDHDAADPIRNFRVGETSGGIAVELDWRLTEFDRIILVGGVSFHYFAGFTGGRKLICPGLASARTISATHELAFDHEKLGRADGVGPGLLDGNRVHEAFMQAASLIDPAFAVNAIVNEKGEAVDLYCGEWIASHRTACEAYAETHSIGIAEKRDVVIVSCGGHPYDINMIQAHKAVDAASHACKDGGTIVLLAECADGLGRDDFLNWFTAENSEALAKHLGENYQVNGQTAWALLNKAERFDIRILTKLSTREASRMRLRPISESELLSIGASEKREGYILPAGAKFLLTN